MTHIINIYADMRAAGTLAHCSTEAEELMRRAAASVLSVHGVECGCAVDIMYTDNAGIRRYNREHRDIDSATDVLSFPMLELLPDEPVIANDDTIDPDTGLVFLGDIIISLERAKEQAGEYGHSTEREMGYLTVHSMLHLLGFDHETDADKALMREKEEAVMETLGLGR